MEEDYGMISRLEQADESNFPSSVKWEIVRHVRNQLLADCDWTQLPDADLTEQEVQAWRDYRQALRNITDSFNTPEQVQLPEKP